MMITSTIDMFMSMEIPFELQIEAFLKLGNLCSAIARLPGMFLPQTFFKNIGLPMSELDSFLSDIYCQTMIFYMGVPGFANDYPCSVWCRWFTACLPYYVGPLFGN